MAPLTGKSNKTRGEFLSSLNRRRFFHDDDDYLSWTLEEKCEKNHRGLQWGKGCTIFGRIWTHFQFCWTSVGFLGREWEKLCLCIVMHRPPSPCYEFNDAPMQMANLWPFFDGVGFFFGKVLQSVLFMKLSYLRLLLEPQVDSDEQCWP